MSAAADVLNGAADLIERDGWVQGSAASIGPARCAGIAIDRTAQRLDTNGYPVVCGFAKFLGLDGFATAEIINWNDTPGRTKADVVAALRAAAERAT